MAATLTPTDAQQFDAIWEWVTGLFDSSLSDQFFKGYQNVVATPYGSYCVISRGTSVRLNQGERNYDATGTAGTIGLVRRTQVQWQIDCYGEEGPDWADIISSTWKSITAADAFVIDASGGMAPLYADEPQQMTIVNSEDQYETRYMAKLYMQVNQTVTLDQEFFTTVDVSGVLPVDVVLK